MAPGHTLAIDVSEAPLAEARAHAQAQGVEVTYAATTWFPANPGLERWLELYGRVARHNDAEPDAGRRLRSWARAAGLRNAAATTSAWCFATPAEREWWGTGMLHGELLIRV